MEKVFYLLAATEAGEEASAGIFGSLGIDWKILIFQAVAFAILAFLLVKLVYPPLLAMFDRRQKIIDDAARAAKEATAQSEKATSEIADRLKKARTEADDIVVVARKQSEQILVEAEAEARKRTDAAIASAQQQLVRDTEAARKTLRNETAELVVLATEKIVGAKVDPVRDAKLINEAISQAQKERTNATAATTKKSASTREETSTTHADKVLDALPDNQQTRQAGLLLDDIEAAILQDRGHLVVNVTSAHPLNDEARAEIIKMVQQETDAKSVELVETIDDSLVGGVIVHTPDAELDASLKARLTRLKTI
ncbi:F0F1 ATP synthase subunit B [Candidatus Saccharibacteria bacterium]|nr:F0F1 ATP synthase subunit B [Candidatus Saccharibacteria bacterium]